MCLVFEQATCTATEGRLAGIVGEGNEGSLIDYAAKNPKKQRHEITVHFLFT
jgi:hypothetical protein